ncbi:MAG TPA: DUF411 domain-containing protein [Noviherbaspirillum sp.]|nr:DUF411 domain-containing protein [Noviherbaspirillum sp.]
MLRKTYSQLFAALLLLASAFAHASAPVIEVYKSQYCGCCEMWVEHLRANGFTVKSNDVDDPSAWRAKLGIPAELGSCHSAKVGDYVIEGHVPAKEIKRLLAEKPNAKGLAVPGMPLGSPGMEADRAEAYDVMLIAADGKHRVYQHYTAEDAARSTPVAALADGEVRKVDMEKGRITIKHGPLANLGMPPMTMAFQADAGLIRTVQAGDKVRFSAEKSGNGYRVTAVEVVR